MPDKFITLANGGTPINLDDFRWITGQVVGGNQSIIQALENLLRGETLVDDFLVSGCVLSGSNPTKSLTAGWVMLGGELLEVAARSGDINDANDNRIILSTSFDATGDKTLLNGATAQTYQKRRGIVSGTSGNIDIRTPKRIMDLRDDTYTTPTFSAGDFVGVGGTWTALSGEITTNRFRILGKTMFWELTVDSTTFAATVTELRCTIPDSKSVKSNWAGRGAHYNDAGTSFTAVAVQGVASNTFVSIIRENSINFGVGTTDQDISFNIAFEIE